LVGNQGNYLPHESENQKISQSYLQQERKNKKMGRKGRGAVKRKKNYNFLKICAREEEVNKKANRKTKKIIKSNLGFVKQRTRGKNSFFF